MKQNVLVGIIAAVALALGILIALNVSPPQSDAPKFMQVYPQAREIKDFVLHDQHGDLVDKQRLQNRWTLAFVGYTFCPDICPTTLAELKRIYPELAEMPANHPLQILFLSVDPGRDTQERLLEYVNFFNPEFIAATGEHAQLFPLVRSMGMMYAMADDTSNPNYLVDHSASVVVVNPQAQVVGRFKPQLEPGKLAISDGDQILADMPLLLGSD